MSADGEVLEWLHALNSEVTQLSAYRQLVAPQLASEFNLLRYARTDEVGLSLILADLLDPNGPHGQGDRFLRGFLLRHWKEQTLSGPVKVRTEVATDRIAQFQRRIDILVDLGTAVLAIENKPWAADQPAQIQSYLAHLDADKRPYRLFYLTGHAGRAPSEHSISAEEAREKDKQGVLKSISYQDVREWLRDCLRCCESERVAMFLRDFERFVDDQFSQSSDDFETRMIVTKALASATAAGAVVQLRSSVANDLRLLLLQALETQLHSEFTLRASRVGVTNWSLAIPKSLNAKHASIEVALHPESALKLAISFEGANCGDCFFGLGRRKANEPPVSGVLIEAFDQCFGVGERSEWWPWSRAFDSRYWWSDHHLWRRIADGSLVGRLLDCLFSMIGIAEQPELRPHFEQILNATEETLLVQRPALKLNAIAHAVLEHKDPKLVDLVFTVERANWAVRKALGRDVVKAIRKGMEESGLCTWSGDETQDLTKAYAWIEFKLSRDPTRRICIEFQSAGCGGAIYGVYDDAIDARSAQAQALRDRLAHAGLPSSKHSAHWIWYHSLPTPNWFDHPEQARAAQSGLLAGETTRVLIELARSVVDQVTTQ